MTFDAKGIGQCQGNLAASAPGDANRALHCSPRFWRVPQIAFEVEDLGTGDHVPVQRRCREELGCAEEGIHCALAIGRHKDQALGGRWLTLARRRREGHVDGTDIVTENLAKLVVCNLADEAAFSAQRSHSGNGVGGRTATDLATGAHSRIELRGPFGADKLHRSLCQLLGNEELLLSSCNHIDDGIADRNYIEAGSSHAVISFVGTKRVA